MGKMNQRKNKQFVMQELNSNNTIMGTLIAILTKVFKFSSKITRLIVSTFLVSGSLYVAKSCSNFLQEISQKRYGTMRNLTTLDTKNFHLFVIFKIDFSPEGYIQTWVD